MYVDPYDEVDALKKSLDILTAKYAKLRAVVEELQNELEVEHFLESGPKGVDPD